MGVSVQCEKCKGTGRLLYHSSRCPTTATLFEHYRPCPDCQGKGATPWTMKAPEPDADTPHVVEPPAR